MHPIRYRVWVAAFTFCCLRSSGVIRKKHSCSNGQLPVEKLCFYRLFLLH
ncbi:hypothetical protein D922_00373 [Enterococcus faecalis 06-MB-DW-09]|nr:hypothetical protein D922_00373 [Enterococcus faecalis 06-MB-DW-09]